MFEKITLDILTQYSVSVKKQCFQDADEKSLPIGEPWRRAYVNSPSGRTQLNDEPVEIIPQTYKDAILSVWGEIPTVEAPSVD